MTTVIGSVPYPWPFHGRLDPEHCALVICRDRRWRVDSPEAERADRALAVLAGALSRAGGMVMVVAPELESAGICDTVPDATFVAARAASAFYASALHDELRRVGIRDLLVAGWGLEGPVHSTLRAANDQGYECLLVADASTPVDATLTEPSCSTVAFSGGIFGAYASTVDVVAALPSPTGPPDGGADNTSGDLAGPPDPAPEDRALSSPTCREQETTMTELAIDHQVLVDADPYPWPCVGALDPGRTALVLIDWQVDFCGPGGYVDRMGYDLSLTRAGLGPTARVLERARAWGCTIVHTREGHRPDLADCPPNKLWRSQRIGAGIGDPGPTGRILVRGEPGWEIVPEVAPVAGELVVDKPGKGAFYATDLGLLLETRGITHLIFTGITTDVCVHTTMRDANDRGYESLLLSDCTGATDEANYRAALKMVTMQGGVFGAVATSEALLAALDELEAREG
jgi:nicotinamidase-related amidase